MFDGQRIIALIPARGGSKGIKNKNIVELVGKPLIAHSIEVALASKYLDAVVVSTDSEHIANVARQYGAAVPFVRPAALAQDDSRTIDVVLHAVKTLRSMNQDVDVVVLLQPTSPLRAVEDIDGAIEKFFKAGRHPLVSVSPVEDHPLLIRSIGDDGELKKLLDINSTCRRQDMPPFYRVNGCIYINNADDLSEETSFNDNPVPFVTESSHSIDIDDRMDLLIAEFYIGQVRKDKLGVCHG